MNPVAEQWRVVADGFTTRVDAVPIDDWSSPSPCEGWTARDVVGHLVEWVPAFFESSTAVQFDTFPAVDDDPAGAWRVLRSGLDATLAQPNVSTVWFEHPRAGRHHLDEAIAMFVLGDVLIHTWDIARATGQDEALDPGAVHEALVGMEALPPGLLESSGQYGLAATAAPGADELTRLLALTGRRA